jgi:hypothetical protein
MSRQHQKDRIDFGTDCRSVAARAQDVFRRAQKGADKGSQISVPVGGAADGVKNESGRLNSR